MIASSGVNSVVTKVAQTEWDLSSSTTGTVKRRPTSLESCKSNSPGDKNEENNVNVDFPKEKHFSDDNANGSSCNINKVKQSDDDLSPEIEEENVIRRKRVVDDVRKINSTPSLKKKFESARKSFSSKLKLPNSLSNLSPSRRSLPNKLSLSQLERQNNLFIRDGQQQQKELPSTVTREAKRKINKVGSDSKNNKIRLVAMEGNAEGNNPPKSKKSLIPSFLSATSSGGGNTKNNSNHIKIQSASASIKKSPNVVEKLTKTGSKFREFYREKQQTNLKRIPPPYRPPPTPLPPQANSHLLNKQNINGKRNRLTENVARNYEEIDVIVEENVTEIEGNNEQSASTTQAIIHNEGDSNIDNMLAKAEYSSNVFKNIPVRPRKGGVSHMDNYCLFDPSVDFCNEKELMKKALTQTKIPIEIAQNFSFSIESEEKIEDITFEDQTVYDITEHDERVAHHNYYEIDPELLEKEEEEEKGKMSSSSDSSKSTTNSSSTTTSSSDYPSLFNSVIDTTQSSNVESTDDNDSNGYGKCQPPKINQQNVSNESVVTVKNAVADNGVKNRKKAPQLDRIIRAGPSLLPTSSRSKQHVMSKTKSSKSNKISENGKGNLQSDKNGINLERQQARPLSTISDDRDSGFLSPATPPDCQNTQNIIESGDKIKDSAMLNQCDNTAIQQLIEVSYFFILCVTFVHKGVHTKP